MYIVWELRLLPTKLDERQLIISFLTFYQVFKPFTRNVSK